MLSPWEPQRSEMQEWSCPSRPPQSALRPPTGRTTGTWLRRLSTFPWRWAELCSGLGLPVLEPPGKSESVHMIQSSTYMGGYLSGLINCSSDLCFLNDLEPQIGKGKPLSHELQIRNWTLEGASSGEQQEGGRRESQDLSPGLGFLLLPLHSLAEIRVRTLPSSM